MSTDANKKTRGAVAASVSSAMLERVVLDALKELEVDIVPSIDGADLKTCSNVVYIEKVAGTSPDGGILYKGNEPILAIECKYNKETGNAIERWFKNYLVMKNVVKTKRYVTFLMGQGFYDDRQPSRILSTVGLFEPLKSSTIYGNNEGNFIQFYRYEDVEEMSTSLKSDLKKELEQLHLI